MEKHLGYLIDVEVDSDDPQTVYDTQSFREVGVISYAKDMAKQNRRKFKQIRKEDYDLTLNNIFYRFLKD